MADPVPEEPPIPVHSVSYSSLLVRAGFRGSTILSQATGFVARHEGRLYLVTNWHVVSGRNPSTGQPLATTAAIPDTLAILHTLSVDVITWGWREEALYDEDGEPLWLEHPMFGRRVDVVALPIAETHGVYYSPYLPDDPGQPIRLSPTAAVSIVGFPFGFTAGAALGVWVQGTLASEPAISYDELPCMLVDSRTRSGQSGSPVVAHRTDSWMAETGDMFMAVEPATRFVGVYSGRIHAESDLGRIWKVEALLEIIRGQKRGPLPIRRS